MSASSSSGQVARPSRGVGPPRAGASQIRTSGRRRARGPRAGPTWEGIRRRILRPVRDGRPCAAGSEPTRPRAGLPSRTNVTGPGQARRASLRAVVEASGAQSATSPGPRSASERGADRGMRGAVRRPGPQSPRRRARSTSRWAGPRLRPGPGKPRPDGRCREGRRPRAGRGVPGGVRVSLIGGLVRTSERGCDGSAARRVPATSAVVPSEQQGEPFHVPDSRIDGPYLGGRLDGQVQGDGDMPAARGFADRVVHLRRPGKLGGGRLHDAGDEVALPSEPIALIR